MRLHTLLAGVVVVVVVAGTGCSSKPKAQPSAHEPTGSPTTTTESARQVTPLEVCPQLCDAPAGEHVLPPSTILPGLRFTLNDGWGVTENNLREIHFLPPHAGGDYSFDDAVLLVRDIRAVKSTGPAAGKRILRDVGPSASALVGWITSNRDFDVIDSPHPVNLGRGIKATELTVQVSHTARFGDPGCPDNPRCAAFYKGKTWGADQFYSIGGDETVLMLFVSLRFSGRPSTLVITLDAKNPNDLVELQRAVRPFLDSLRLPTQ